jgi:hypothetical protein
MPIQRTFKRTTALGVIMACVLMLPVGCYTDGGSVSNSTSVNNQTGAVTNTTTVTINIKRGHPPLQQFTAAMASMSGTDLFSLDPSQAILSYSLSNATIASTNGLVTVTLTDDTTGVVVGQQTFQYIVNGNSLFVQDPSAVSSWLNQFSSNSNLDVGLNLDTDVQAITSGTATVTSNAVYQGVNYASGSASWAASFPSGGGGCHTRFCPNQ